jgi:hypothetical protein
MAALLMTAMFWVIVTVMLIATQGESLPRAATFASFSAIGGLILWALYRVISGRNDGLVSSFIAAMVVVAVRPERQVARPLMPELARCTIELGTVAVVICFWGLFLRYRSKDIHQRGSSPLGDPDVDPPLSR